MFLMLFPLAHSSHVCPSETSLDHLEITLPPLATLFFFSFPLTKKKQLPGFQRDTHLVPGIPKVVAISVSHCNKRLYGVNVFLLHFCDAGAGRQQGEASESLHVGIAFQL